MNKEPCPAEPHPLLLFATNTSGRLAQEIAYYLEVELSAANIHPHPNGECMVRGISDNIRSRDVFVIGSVCRRWLPTAEGYTGVNDSLMELLVWGDALSRASARRVTAVIPYFGYARQDRKDASRTPISARLVADLLQEAGFGRVITMDLHSDQIQGFFHRSKCHLDHLNAGQLFTEHVTGLGLEDAVVLSPDVGNVKKADRYRRGLPSNIGLAVIDKRRDPKTGKVITERLTGDDVEGKSVLIFDDIISTAGTMRGAIDLAIKHKAKEFIIGATHGEFIGSALEKLDHPLIRQVCITDTIPLLPGMDERMPLHVLSVKELFAEAILRVHRGESISELL